MTVSEKTLSDLEWSRLVDAVRARCIGPQKERLDLSLADTISDAQRSLDESAELLRLFDEREELPLESLVDLEPSLARIEKLGALEGPALRDIRNALRSARVLHRFLADRKARMPLVLASCSVDPTLVRLEDEIAHSIEADGTVSDKASPTLRSLRQEVAALRTRIVSRLDELVQKHSDVLSDRIHTLREGRHVLPMRRDAHERIAGIVHGTSASGATVFIEPRALIGLGNRLKMAAAEMEHEEARVLAFVSDLVRERIHEVRHAVQVLDYADARQACARLGHDLRGTVPRLSPEPRMHLVRVRHPLLALETSRVVPCDLELESGRALVISGPNAGGKTVALKTAGLVALMVRAGLPIPADEAHVCGFFTDVLTDIGDEQSLVKNLSTFSAHVRNLKNIVDDAGQGSLVLLDELATGTDPEEGGALACAVTTHLCANRAAVIVTTHYEALKALAVSDSRLRNASVGFNMHTLQPTFELRLDVPGASSALLVAGSFGLAASIIETARGYVPERARAFEELVQRLDSATSRVQEERSELADERRQIHVLRESLQKELANARARDRKAISNEATRLVEELRAARESLIESKRAAKESANSLNAASLKSSIEHAQTVASRAPVSEPTKNEVDDGEPLPFESITPGKRAWVPRLRTEVEILEVQGPAKIRVSAGLIKLTVRSEELFVPRTATGVESRLDKSRLAPTAAPRDGVPQYSPSTSDNTIDIRGMRVEDALTLVDTFLDRLFAKGERMAYIQHGVGTGALRDAVRQHLKTSHYVKKARAADLEDGGDRCTAAELKG